MAMQNRKTLKEYFKNGNLPTEENFSDLIDSMVNIRSDGIHRTNDRGFYITASNSTDRLISFFKPDDEWKPVWSIDLHNTSRSLLIKNTSDTNTVDDSDIRFSITPEGNVGIKNCRPAYELDVNGTIRCSGRIGNYGGQLTGTITIPADGEWHTLLGNLYGCHAYEIMAGVGKRKSGKYSLMHAIAINVFGRGKKIRYTQSYYQSRNDSIRLKWVGDKKSYSLLIRTMSDYGSFETKPIHISCNITRLWFDETMSGD